MINMTEVEVLKSTWVKKGATLELKISSLQSSLNDLGKGDGMLANK